MTIRSLPAARTFARPQNFQWDAPATALDQWAGQPRAAEADDPDTISIFDVIGDDYWTGGGFTAKRMAGALRAIGGKDVTVKINSPGGDMFEGIAIYNILREHPARVTVDVMGMAASAASIIAMAGDTIRMGLGTFIMVHNAWSVVVGNRNDLRAAADLFDEFDSALVDIYVARTGLDRKAVEKLMDAETFMSPQTAVDNGFADEINRDAPASPVAARNATDDALFARRRVDALLAKSGMPRSERRRLFRNLGGMPDAAADLTAMPCAGVDLTKVRTLIDSIKQRG